MNKSKLKDLDSNSWIDEVPEESKQKVLDLFSKADTFSKKLNVLKEWHPKSHVNLTPISTLEEYFKYIRHAANDSTWFRGESKDYQNLIPKLYRHIKEDKIEKRLEKERKYFFEFRSRSRSIAPSVNSDDIWSWYFLIQHYGGPTRLLDWTKDATVALYFALDTNRKSTGNPIVSIIQPNVLSDYVFKELGEERTFRSSVLYPGESPTELWISNLTSNYSFEMPNAPIALFPPHSDPRITAQSSCFTLFGNQILGFLNKGKDLVCPCCDRKIINRLVIDGHKKDSLRRELSRIGITSGKVFPGLEGICKEIEDEIFNQK